MRNIAVNIFAQSLDRAGDLRGRRKMAPSATTIGIQLRAIDFGILQQCAVTESTTDTESIHILFSLWLPAFAYTSAICLPKLGRDSTAAKDMQTSACSVLQYITLTRQKLRKRCAPAGASPASTQGLLCRQQPALGEPSLSRCSPCKRCFSIVQ